MRPGVCCRQLLIVINACIACKHAIKTVIGVIRLGLSYVGIRLQDRVAIKRAFAAAQQRKDANLALALKVEQLIGELVNKHVNMVAPC
jgi:hypothetical protein